MFLALNLDEKVCEQHLQRGNLVGRELVLLQELLRQAAAQLAGAQLARDALRLCDHVRAGRARARQRPIDACAILGQATQVLLHRIQRLWQANALTH